MPTSELPDLLREQDSAASGKKRAACLILAFAIWTVAIIGLFIPVFPSSPFWVTGAVFAAIGSDKMRRLINSLERKLSEKHRIKIRRGLRKIPIEAVRRWVQPIEENAANRGEAPDSRPPRSHGNAPSHLHSTR